MSPTYSASTLRVRPNPVVAGLEPYSPGRLELPVDLALDANESLEPAPAVSQALAAAAADPPHRYSSTAEVEAALAASWQLDPARVLVTAGADDALERAIRSVAAPGRRAVLTTPSFTMLVRYARLAGADAVEVPWWSGDFPVERVLGAAGNDTALITVVSPNNPTGAVISATDLERLADARPESLVLLDHAYAEFAEADLTGVALRHANVVVFRTFSKAWGAAGLRLGYALGDARVIGWMRSVGQPYSVSAPSLAALRRLLVAGPSPPRDRIRRVTDQRADLTGLLAGLGCEVLPSQGNFLLVRPPDAAFLHRGLATLGIGIRRFAGHPELEPWLRVTVPGDPTALDRLVRGLRSVLAPEALLFDMDGVLADVSGSYREAIVQTAASWGVALRPEDIATAKAAGDATNDWRLTHRLLAANGVETDLDEVTRRFEALYQGRPDEPGLYHRERLRITPETLAQMARHRPLAVVTGRPRRDAERFLDDHGLRGLFSTLICMEDAPSKPDPAPVRLALARLGATTAWMVGDTPDDLVAARAAGVLPIGVVAPGEDESKARQTLLAAGAATVLGDAQTLEEILP